MYGNNIIYDLKKRKKGLYILFHQISSFPHNIFPLTDSKKILELHIISCSFIYKITDQAKRAKYIATVWMIVSDGAIKKNGNPVIFCSSKCFSVARTETGLGPSSYKATPHPIDTHLLQLFHEESLTDGVYSNWLSSYTYYCDGWFMFINHKRNLQTLVNSYSPRIINCTHTHILPYTHRTDLLDYSRFQTTQPDNQGRLIKK